MENIKIVINENEAHLYTPYNSDFVKKIKGIGGSRWESSERYWIIPSYAVDEAREIMRQIYGCDDRIEETKETVKLKIKVVEKLFSTQDDVNMFGRCLCHASGRDSEAKAGTGVIYVNGGPKSGGSVKNWCSVVPAGSEIVLPNVSKALYDAYVADERIKVEIVPECPSREKLLAEKEQLLARIASIDEMLRIID